MERFNKADCGILSSSKAADVGKPEKTCQLICKIEALKNINIPKYFIKDLLSGKKQAIDNYTFKYYYAQKPLNIGEAFPSNVDGNTEAQAIFIIDSAVETRCRGEKDIVQTTNTQWQ